MMAVPAMKAPPKKRTPKVTQEPPAPAIDVQVLSENLDRALKLLRKVVGRSEKFPMQERVLFETERGRLKLTGGANNEHQVSVWIGARIDAEGAWLLRPRDLEPFVRANASTVRFTRQAGAKAVHVSTRGHVDGMSVEYSAADGDPDAWPVVKAFTPGRGLVFDARTFARDIERVLPCTTWDDSRPVLTAVLFKNDPEKLTIAAADGFRLAVIERPSMGDEAWEILIPYKDAKLMADVAKAESWQESAQLEINASRTQVRFSVIDTEVIAQLIQGTFPSIGHLIPKEVRNRFTFMGTAFVRAVGYIMPLAATGDGVSRIEAHDGAARFSAKGEYGETDLRVAVGVPLVSAPLVCPEESRIAFNVRFLSDVAKVFRGSASVELAFTSAGAVGQFSDPADPSLRILVMPVYVQW